MHLTGLHILLTCKCVYECDHCFIWGSPRQSGVFSLERLDDVLRQLVALGTVKDLAFEGGETFVYYPILIEAVRRAASFGFRTAVRTNGYWATGSYRAYGWLKRLAAAGLQRVEIPAEKAHGIAAARALHLETRRWHADERVAAAQRRPWATFNHCPHTDLVLPDRLYLDPFGYLHLCPGVVLGNLFLSPLSDLLAVYHPDTHPVVGPLLVGGPAELVRHYRLAHEWDYADACQLCHSIQAGLRARFPTLLNANLMLGASGSGLPGDAP